MLISGVLIIFLLLLLSIDGGIKGFRKILRSNFPKCLAPIKATVPPAEYDHVCIDMNQILHSAIRKLGKSNNEKKMYGFMFFVLDEVFRLARPTKSVVFAFDGPAPFAKLNLQRSRRTKDSVANQLSPGTAFMEDMEEIILVYLLQRLRRPQFEKLNYYISGAETPGEGEIKIIQWINRFLPKDGCDDTIVLYGADSDMVVQAMCVNTTRKVFVIQSEPAKINLCNVSTIVSTIVEGNLGANPCEESVRVEVLNHVFLMLLRGNDYLPSLGGISKINSLQVYRKAFQSSMDDRRLFREGVSKFNYAALFQLMQSFGQDRHDISNSNFVGPFSLSDVLIKLLYFRNQAFVWDEFVLEHSAGGQASSLPCPPEQLLVVPLSCQGLPARHIPAEQIVSSFPFPSMSYKSKKEGRREAVQSALSTLFPTYMQLFQQLVAAGPAGAAGELEAVRGVYRKVLEDFQEDEDDEVEDDDETDSDAEEGDAGDSLKDSSFDNDNEGGLARDNEDKGKSDRYDPIPPVYDNSRSSPHPSNVPHYLRGLLWVMHMYTTGKCIDHSYSYSASTRVSATDVRKYFEKMVAEVGREKGFGEAWGVEKGLQDAEVIRRLDKEICVPAKNRNLRPLSPSAICICVFPTYPRGVGRYVPSPLRGLWTWINKHYFRRGAGVAVGYEELVEGMETYIRGQPVLMKKQDPVISNKRSEVNLRQPQQDSRQQLLSITAPDNHKWSILCPTRAAAGYLYGAEATSSNDVESSDGDNLLSKRNLVEGIRYSKKRISLPFRKPPAAFVENIRSWPVGFELYESLDEELQ